MNNNIKKKRKDLLPLFFLISIVLHLILFLALSNSDVLDDLKQLVKKREQKEDREQFIEISEIPVKKETEPPKETKRLADKSHKTEKETTRDDITKFAKSKPVKKPEITPPVKVKEPTPKKVAKPEKIKKPEKKTEPKKVEEKKKKYEVRDDILRNNKQASLPKQKFDNLKEESQKTTEAEKSVPRSQSQNSPNIPFDYNTNENLLGSKSVNNKEAVVDLNTTQYKYTSYFVKLREKIYQVWKYPDESRFNRESGNLRIVFTIRSDGQLEDVRLLSSSGYQRLDNEVLRTIKVASPFYPFPQSWEEERLKIPATFDYRLDYGSRFIR